MYQFYVTRKTIFQPFMSIQNIYDLYMIYNLKKTRFPKIMRRNMTPKKSPFFFLFIEKKAHFKIFFKNTLLRYHLVEELY